MTRWVAALLFLNCCAPPAPQKAEEDLASVDSAAAFAPVVDSLPAPAIDSTAATTGGINTRNVLPKSVVDFALTLQGVPYKYASTDPAQGFDCSGFITYVFHHFGIDVPRSSIDFTNEGKEVPVFEARPGDLILFTGTDSTERHVGHMGLVVRNERDTLQFIHSTSGKQHGVTITLLNDYYRGRFMKTIRVFGTTDTR